MTEPARHGLSGITAAILAGGLGTRLRSVLTDKPKVLAEIHGRPFLSYLLDWLQDAGVRRVVLLIGYRGDEIRKVFGDSYKNLTLRYSEESSPLGTAGAVRRALPMIDSDPALVMNGDAFCDADIGTFYAWHCAADRAGSLLLTEVHDSSRYGRVALDQGGRVLRFEEKSGHSGPGLINAGVYLLSRRVLESIPEGRAVSIEHEVFPNWIGQDLHGYQTSGRFIDIGTPESYAASESFFASLAS